MEKLKRYIVFLIGLFINSLGVSLITKADLGTSPISSIPYVLSLNFPFTLGQFTIAFSLLLIGCVILGFGVYTEALADAAMLPGGIVRPRCVFHMEDGIRIHKGCF